MNACIKHIKSVVFSTHSVHARKPTIRDNPKNLGPQTRFCGSKPPATEGPTPAEDPRILREHNWCCEDIVTITKTMRNLM